MKKLSEVSAVGRAQDGSDGAHEEHQGGDVLDRVTLMEKHAKILEEINIPEVTNHEKLAYYRACNGDVSNAGKRLQATLQWRRERNLDDLLNDPAMLKKERELRRVLWYDYLSPDKHGRPVLVQRVGRWNVDQVLLTIYQETNCDDPAKDSRESLDEFQDLHILSCETLLQMSREQSKKSSVMLDDRGQVIIMDLQGLNPWHLSRKLASAFGTIAQLDSDHYPDTLAHVWIVNAPCLFRVLCKMVRHFLDPDTIGKFHVSSGVPVELVGCVGEHCLPEELGGRRKGVFPYNESGKMSDFPRS